MLVPCKIKFGLEAAESGNQQALTVQLVDDEGQVLHTLDQQQLTPGQDFTFGPVHVHASIDSTLETEGAPKPEEPATPQAAMPPQQGAKRGTGPGRPGQPPHGQPGPR